MACDYVEYHSIGRALHLKTGPGRISGIGMSKYGQCAVAALNRIRDQREQPRSAWHHLVSERFPKSCPMVTFLVLCEEGLLSGVPPGKYANPSADRRRRTFEAI